MPRIQTLQKRSQFQRVRGGGRSATASFVLEGKARPLPDRFGGPRFGFTVTKKLGGAVVRNRIRRRLKAALAETMLELAVDGFDYVIVARSSALECEYPVLTADFVTAFKRVHASPARISRSEPKAP